MTTCDLGVWAVHNHVELAGQNWLIWIGEPHCSAGPGYAFARSALAVTCKLPPGDRLLRRPGRLDPTGVSVLPTRRENSHERAAPRL